MRLFHNRLILYWKIGKDVYEKKDLYENVIEKYSDYYTYLFGNSFLFTRENIHFMKRFYLNFPIFYSSLEKISWEQYKLLLEIDNREERIFYFQISLLFESDYNETVDFIKNQYYLRI